MLNWKECGEWKKFKDVIRPDDEVSMPEIATEAFKLTRGGIPYKVRLLNNEHKLQAYSIHEFLYNQGWTDLPKPCGIEEVNGKKFSFVEWLEGKTFWELFYEKALTTDDFYEFGLWLGRLNQVKYEGMNISFLNYFHKNIFKKANGDIQYLDLNKAYLTDSPFNFIDKYIITEDIVTFPQRDAFLAGYRANSPYDIEKVIAWHYQKVYTKYHDIYLHGELFFKGSRGVQDRLKLMALPKNLKGKRVLDLGCSGGSFSLECALRGAEYVYGVDTEHKNIKRGPTECHHRLSDMTKLIAYFHGFDGRDLHFKHIEIDSDWFIDTHIGDSGKKWDIIFCMALMGHISLERKEKLMASISKSTDLLYYEGNMDNDLVKTKKWLEETTQFTDYVYLGQTKDITGKYTYHLFKCQRRKRQQHEVCREIFKETFGDRPIVGVEIGTGGGGWTNHILTYLKNVQLIHCIDPWKHFENGFFEQIGSQEMHDHNYKDFLNKLKSHPGRIKTHRMGSMEAIEHLKEEKFDFIYIDGCHEEDYVKHDIEKFWPLVKPGGFFGGHDYGLVAGVTRQVDKHFPNVNKEEDFVWWVIK